MDINRKVPVVLCVSRQWAGVDLLLWSDLFGCESGWRAHGGRYRSGNAGFYQRPDGTGMNTTFKESYTCLPSTWCSSSCQNLVKWLVGTKQTQTLTFSVSISLGISVSGFLHLSFFSGLWTESEVAGEQLWRHLQLRLSEGRTSCYNLLWRTNRDLGNQDRLQVRGGRVREILSGQWDSSKLICASSSCRTALIKGHTNVITGSNISADHRHLATVSLDFMLKVGLKQITFHFVCCLYHFIVYFFLSLKQSVLSLLDHFLCMFSAHQVWSSTQCHEIAALTSSSPMNCVTFDPEGRLLAAGCWDGKVIVWNWLQNDTQTVSHMLPV